MEQVTRRAVLGAGAAGALSLALAGCSPARPEPFAPPTSPVAGSLTPFSTPRPTPTVVAGGPPPWNSLASRLSGSLVLPDQPAYAQAKLTENPSYDGAEPLAVLEAKSPRDVAAGLAFARAHSVPLAVRSGGHSYPGWSAGGAPGTGIPPSLVIDTHELSTISIASDGLATVGAGASLAAVYSALGGAGRAIGAGSCATVGAAGLTLGGGVGVLTRAFGLTCDQVSSFQIVTADGVLRTASVSSEPELFWACRGGGGGHLGVVTSITYVTQPAPTVTTFYYDWPFSTAAVVIAAWQAWMPGTDDRLWTTLKVLGGESHPGGPAISMSGTWIGPSSSLSAQLGPFLSRIGTPPADQNVRTEGYLDAMMSYAGCSGVPIAQCHTGSGGALTREPFANVSHIGTAALDSAGIAALLAQARAAQTVAGLTEGGISMDALGGRVASLSPTETAFYYRNAPATVQYTSTFATGASPEPYLAYVRDFRAALTPWWGNTAYVNYADASLRDPATAYFGDNAAGLAAVAHRYDPTGLFTQPQPY